jgi:DNA repair protein RecN (Recombination protein N)
MHGAKLEVQVKPQQRTSTGEDLIEFWLQANVGEPAVLVKEGASGGELRALGQFRQVLCITHFPQVACFADIHFRVIKEEKEGRTLARIDLLNKKEREQELVRMLGGKKIPLPLMQ